MRAQDVRKNDRKSEIYDMTDTPEIRTRNTIAMLYAIIVGVSLGIAIGCGLHGEIWATGAGGAGFGWGVRGYLHQFVDWL